MKMGTFRLALLMVVLAGLMGPATAAPTLGQAAALGFDTGHSQGMLAAAPPPWAENAPGNSSRQDFPSQAQDAQIQLSQNRNGSQNSRRLTPPGDLDGNRRAALTLQRDAAHLDANDRERKILLPTEAMVLIYLAASMVVAFAAIAFVKFSRRRQQHPH